MLLTKQPKAPKGFNRGASSARRTIRSIVSQGGRPKSEDFADEWSAFKHVLAEAQNGRCGYCDREVLGGDDGTIDHYRPKAEVDALYDDPNTWGTQKPYSASVQGRKKQLVSESAYHWLAYAWSNYVFACSCCNEKWKRSFFPVAAHPRCCPPRPGRGEEPLLLHCYRGRRPSEHLRFNSDGSIEPVNSSRYGYETIRTVGLYRHSLEKERFPIALRVYDALFEYAQGDAARRHRAVRDLQGLGRADRAFGGVARAIVEDQTGVSWEEFVTL